MTDNRETILNCLSDIGLGPQRIGLAKNGTPLFGVGGLLNSIELVQLVAALSERSGIDSLAFMEHFDGATAGIFSSVGTLETFLGESLSDTAAMVG